MLGLLLILISKSGGGGFSHALLSATSAMCVCMYLGGCLN